MVYVLNSAFLAGRCMSLKSCHECTCSKYVKIQFETSQSCKLCLIIHLFILCLLCRRVCALWWNCLIWLDWIFKLSYSAGRLSHASSKKLEMGAGLLLNFRNPCLFLCSSKYFNLKIAPDFEMEPARRVRDLSAFFLGRNAIRNAFLQRLKVPKIAWATWSGRPHKN